jgi:hypothetical protein
VLAVEHCEIDVDPESPRDGDWHAPAFFFDREHGLASPGDSKVGRAPLVIRVIRD